MQMMEKGALSNLSIALNHIENVYTQFNNLINNENSLNEKERSALYDYGLDKARIDLVRLVNIKKSLAAIMTNRRIIL